MGDAARRAEPGEPRQPARGRQEREALVATTTGRTARGTRSSRRHLFPPEPPVPPPDDRLDGGPRRRVARRRAARSSGPTTRRTTRSSRSSATSSRPRPRRGSERYFGAIPANPAIPRLGDLSLPPTLGGERRETVPDRVPLPRIYFGFRAPAFGDPRLDALEVAGQILAGGKGSRLHRRLVRDERIAQDVALFALGFVGGASIAAGWATVRPGVDGRARSRRPSTRSSSGSRASRSPTTSWPARGR